MEDSGDSHASHRKTEADSSSQCVAGNANHEGNWNEGGVESCTRKAVETVGQTIIQLDQQAQTIDRPVYS
jgi:hypothetical protein